MPTRRRLVHSLVAACVIGGIAALALVVTSSRGPDEAPLRRIARHRDPAPASQFFTDRTLFESATRPAVVPGNEADWLRPDDAVFGVVVDEHARAYPIFILAWHHVVNDVIESTPIAVNYCVLCSSAIAFDPVVDGRPLTFGVDGAWQGTTTIFDHETDSLWLHLTGECVRGPMKGTVLRQAATGRHTTWADWRASYPATDVMRPVSERKGGGDIPYFTREGTRRGLGFMPPDVERTVEHRDHRLGANELVYGAEVAGVACAYPLSSLRTERIVADRVGGVAVTVWFDPAHRSAAGFRPSVRGRALTFAWDEAGSIRDRETSSTWNMDGLCIAGKLAGERLAPLPGLVAEWYGWSAHYPDTLVWGLP